MNTWFKAFFTGSFLMLLLVVSFRVEKLEQHVDLFKDRYPKVVMLGEGPDGKSQQDILFESWLKFNDPGIFAMRNHKMGFSWDKKAQIKREERVVKVLPASPLKTASPAFDPINLYPQVDNPFQRLFEGHSIFLSTFADELEATRSIANKVYWCDENGNSLVNPPLFDSSEIEVIKTSITNVKSPTRLTVESYSTGKIPRVVLTKSCGDKILDMLAVRKLTYHIMRTASVNAADLPKGRELVVEWRLWRAEK